MCMSRQIMQIWTHCVTCILDQMQLSLLATGKTEKFFPLRSLVIILFSYNFLPVTGQERQPRFRN